jgi:hypothetical protein
VICLYRSKLWCFTRRLLIAIATINPMDHGDGQRLRVHSSPPAPKPVAVDSLYPPKRLTGIPLGRVCMRKRGGRSCLRVRATIPALIDT